MTACMILTGGRSRRMGRDKSALEYHGSTLLESAIDKYAPLFSPLYISVREKSASLLPGTEEIADIIPGCGPISGLHALFSSTSVPHAFVTAVDIPNGSAPLALKLCALLGEADACVIRRENGWIEPMFAVYSRKCLLRITEAIENGEYKLGQMLQKAKVRYVDELELSPEGLESCLFNVNTPEDYKSLIDNSI